MTDKPVAFTISELGEHAQTVVAIGGVISLMGVGGRFWCRARHFYYPYTERQYRLRKEVFRVNFEDGTNKSFSSQTLMRNLMVAVGLDVLFDGKKKK